MVAWRDWKKGQQFVQKWFGTLHQPFALTKYSLFPVAGATRLQSHYDQQLKEAKAPSGPSAPEPVPAAQGTVESKVKRGTVFEARFGVKVLNFTSPVLWQSPRNYFIC